MKKRLLIFLVYLIFNVSTILTKDKDLRQTYPLNNNERLISNNAS